MGEKGGVVHLSGCCEIGAGLCLMRSGVHVFLVAEAAGQHRACCCGHEIYPGRAGEDMELRCLCTWGIGLVYSGWDWWHPVHRKVCSAQKWLGWLVSSAEWSRQ